MLHAAAVTKNNLLIGLVVFLAGLLLGFLPQYLETRELRTDLEVRSERIASLESALQMAELRDLAGLMLLETLRRNFGLAQDYSTRYFEALQRAIAGVEDPARRADLEDLLDRRDAVTTVLAEGDPASGPDIQALYARTNEVTRGP